MDTRRTKTCPICGGCDPDCIPCDGAGVVDAGLDLCPGCGGEGCRLCCGLGLVEGVTIAACPGCGGAESTWLTGAMHQRHACPYCGGLGHVATSDLPEIYAELGDEADYQRDPYAYYGVSRSDF